MRLNGSRWLFIVGVMLAGLLLYLRLGSGDVTIENIIKTDDVRGVSRDLNLIVVTDELAVNDVQALADDPDAYSLELLPAPGEDKAIRVHNFLWHKRGSDPGVLQSGDSLDVYLMSDSVSGQVCVLPQYVNSPGVVLWLYANDDDNTLMPTGDSSYVFGVEGISSGIDNYYSMFENTVLRLCFFNEGDAASSFRSSLLAGVRIIYQIEYEVVDW